MLQRDYFIRIIEEFMAAVSRFLEKDPDRRTDDDLRDLYRQYVGDYDTLRNLPADEALRYAREQWADDRRAQKLEMLAELLRAEGSYKQQPLRGMLLEKALLLFCYVDSHSTDFSIARKAKIAALKDRLGTGLQAGETLNRPL